MRNRLIRPAPRILLVDDREQERRLLGERLRLHGFRFYVGTDGNDAVEKARYILPDLILMDIYMPGCDGIAACRQLKADPKTAGIPIIFLSAAGLPEERVIGLSEGAVDYITKPYDFEELKLRISVHLAQSAGIGNAAHAREAHEDDQGDSVEHRVYRTAQRLLLDDLAKTPELSTLARAVGTNTRNLNEAFRKLTGVTALSYLRERRMTEARRLLRDTRLDVQSIAIDLGYGSPANFSTAFRERFGMSPRDFRKIIKDGVGVTDVADVDSAHASGDDDSVASLSGDWVANDPTGSPGSHGLPPVPSVPLAAEDGHTHHDAQLDAVFASSPDGLIAFDADCRVKYANPVYLQMTGQTNTEIVGLGKAAFFASLSAICLPTESSDAAGMWQALIDDATGQHRLRIELAGDVRRVLELTLRYASTATVSQILYVRDVTNETEVNKQKSDFVSQAAHELRAPMASVFGFSELLITNDFDSETRKDLLRTIYKQTAGLIEIINELLDLSRIESRGGKCFNIRALALDTVVDEVLKEMHYDRASHPVKVDLPSDLQLVMADGVKLRQALTNILSNAVKYSPEGGQITVRADMRSDASHEFVVVTVTDQGIGMTPEQMARVGERFFRADGSGKIQGTGLGMSIVKEIVERFGGKVELASVLREGTAVALWLPAAGEEHRCDASIRQLWPHVPDRRFVAG